MCLVNSTLDRPALAFPGPYRLVQAGNVSSHLLLVGRRRCSGAGFQSCSCRGALSKPRLALSEVPSDHALGRAGWRCAWAESLAGRLDPAVRERNCPEMFARGMCREMHRPPGARCVGIRRRGESEKRRLPSAPEVSRRGDGTEEKSTPARGSGKGTG